MERGVAVRNLQWRGDGTTEVEGGLETPAEAPSVRTEGDNRNGGGRNSQVIYNRMLEARITKSFLRKSARTCPNAQGLLAGSLLKSSGCF